MNDDNNGRQHDNTWPKDHWKIHIRSFAFLTRFLFQFTIVSLHDANSSESSFVEDMWCAFNTHHCTTSRLSMIPLTARINSIEWNWTRCSIKGCSWSCTWLKRRIIRTSHQWRRPESVIERGRQTDSRWNQSVVNADNEKEIIRFEDRHDIVSLFGA